MQLRFVGKHAGLKNGLALTAGLLALYALLGFFLLPVVVGRQLVSGIYDSLQREAVIEEVAINPFLLTIELKGFALRGASGDDLVGFDRLFIDLQAESVLNRAVTLREITLEGALVDAIIDPSGELNLMQLVPPADDEAAAETAEEPSAPPALIIRSLALREARARFTDESASTPFRLHFVPVSFTLRELHIATGDESEEAPIDLELSLEGGGALKVVGGIDYEPMRAAVDLELEGLRLAQLQPLIDDVSQLDLRSGELSVKGHLSYESGQAPALEFAGGLSLSDLVVHDDVEEEDILRLPAVAVNGVRAQVDPLVVSVERVALSEPYLRFAIGPDGTTNFDRAMAPEGSAPAAGGPPPAQAQTLPQGEASPPPSIRIDEIDVDRGSAWFEDLSLRPAFATQIGQLEGGLKGMGTAADSRATLQLTGETGPHAPVRVEGSFQLFSPEPSLTLEIVFRSLDLTAFTPYSGRFAGYAIEQGRMDMDLAYALQGRHLRGSNALLLDQLTLGERIESPDALTLPVKLGLALLKDAKGRIDINLEVEGDVDDPEFSAAGLIWQAFVNLLTKAVTRPFDFLGALAGGEPPPDGVAFEPGLSRLGAREATDLETLAEALTARPGLVLEISGSASRMVDAPVLAQQLLEKQLLAIYSEQKSGGATKPVEFLGVQERTRAIERLYERNMAEARATSSVAAPPPAKETDTERIARYERELLARSTAPPDLLRELADRRADKVASYLTEMQALEADRLRVGKPVVEDGAEDDPPLVRMTLDARS